MKKHAIIAICFSLFSALSCKKDEKSEKPANFTPPAMFNQADAIKQAHAKPLTNLALSENDFNFGKIKKGDTVEHTYEVTNTGKNPLIISMVKPGCGCTVPEYTKTPILSGEKGNITLKFDSSHFDGTVHKQAEIYANVEKIPIVITFSADIQPK